MTNSLESFSNTDPFAAAIALQEEHARAYAKLADRIRSESPEAASILLTMRQRQQSELRKLMCVYGFSSSKRASSIPHSRVLVAGDGERTVLVQILLSYVFVWREVFEIQAARTAAQISGAVVGCPVSGLRLNCCFLIFSASSMPRIVTAAVSNRLNPSIGRIRCFIRR